MCFAAIQPLVTPVPVSMAGVAPASPLDRDCFVFAILAIRSYKSSPGWVLPGRLKTPGVAQEVGAVFRSIPECPRQTALCQLGFVSSHPQGRAGHPLLQLCLHRAPPDPRAAVPLLDLGTWWSLLSPHAPHKGPGPAPPSWKRMVWGWD